MAMAGGSEAVGHVIQCLQNCLYSIDGETRKAAEQQLDAGVHHSGFASTLATLATDASLTGNDIGARQLAAVLLKQIIKKHWSAEAPKFQPPELSRDERAHIQAVLPAGLADSCSKVRTAIAMCIAAIAKTDPDGWPGLTENLVGAIHTQRAIGTPLVHGAIRCFSMLSDDIDEQQLPQVARVLLPELLVVVGDTASAQDDLRAAALSILYDMLRSLGVIAGVYQRQVRDLLVPLVEPWLPLLCGVVAQPLNVEDSSGWAARMLCLKCLTQLVAYFSRALQASHIGGILQVCWRTFSESLALYQVYLVLEPSEGGKAGDEGAQLPVPATEVDLLGGDTLDLESLLAQLFELLMALLGVPRHAKLIRPALPEMSYLVVAYMQMTARQAAEWVDNAAQYVADEEDSTFTVRVSGELLVDTMVQAFGFDGVGALMDAVERRMAEAAAAQAAGQNGWWKLREAALLAAGCCMSSFPGVPGGDADLGGGGGGPRQRAAAAALQSRLQAVVDQVLRVDLQGSSVNPLLVGRAMWLAARLNPVLRPDQRGLLLAAAAAGLNSDLPAPVKIGACRALAALTPRVAPGVLAPLCDCLYGGLLALLATSAEDALNLVLESMVPLIKADQAAAARALPALSGPLLQVWSRHVTDPLVAAGSLEVLGALARVPACLGPLAAQVVPVVAGVVRQPEDQPDGLLEGCLDLLRQLVRPGQREVVAGVAAAVVGPVLELLPGGSQEHVDDSRGALAHGVSELLVELLRAGREEVLTWAVPSFNLAGASNPASASGTPPGPTTSASVFSALLAACLRLLDPTADEYRTALAGDFAAALVRCLPSYAAVQPVLGELLGACCRKLAASNLSPLVGGLLAALGYMAVAGGAAGWLEALNALRVEKPADRPGAAPTLLTGLEVVLPALLERHGDVRGRLSSRAVCVAMLEALKSRHPLLMSVTVRGKRQDLATGVRTRRQAAAAGGEQWTSVPAAVKMTAVVGEMLVEQPWEGGAEEDDEDEDDDDDDDDGDEEDGEDEGDSDGDGFSDDEEGGEGGDEREGQRAGDGEAGGGGGGGAGLQDGHGGRGPSSRNLDLSLSGRGINQQQQASLDAHIDRSPILPADSAVVAGDLRHSENQAHQIQQQQQLQQQQQQQQQQQPQDPLMALDLRRALVEALGSLRSGGPETSAFLAAAMDLLPTRTRQRLAEALG